MAGKSSQSNNRGSDLFGYFVSGKHKEYHTNQYGAPQTPPSGLTATGGAISDYIEPGGNIYRAHLFTSSGSFDVTSTSGDYGSTIDYLVVGGGGGGGKEGGGGGAGGVRSNHPDTPSPKRGTALQLLLALIILLLLVQWRSVEFSYVLVANHQQELMEMDRILDLVHRFLSTPLVEVVEEVKGLILQDHKLLKVVVVLVDLVVVLVVTLTALVVVVLQPHSPTNYGPWM